VKETSSEEERNIDYCTDDDDQHDDTKVAEEPVIADDPSSSGSHLQCAICLVDFEQGDEISWSDDDECHHHFHRYCILKWLLRHKDCPTCRRLYWKGDKVVTDNVENEPAADVEAPAVAVRPHHPRPQIAGPMYSDAVLFASAVRDQQS